jgi:hypothetical protein
MPKLLSNSIILAVALLSSTPSLLAAQPSRVRYDNVGELMGAAFVDLSVQFDNVQHILRRCGANSKSVQAKSPAIIKAWQLRNAKLQGLLPVYTRIIGAPASLMSSTGRLTGKTAIDAALGANKNACDVLVGNINSGSFDIGTNPQIKIYLTESFKEFSVNGNPIEPIVVLCYEQFYGGDKVSAKSSCSRAAARGSAYGQFLHGLMLMPSNGTDPNEHSKAREFVIAAAIAGVTDAQRSIASDYHVGLTGPVDFARAKYWYEKAVAQFDRLAPVNLGGMYLQGQGVQIDVQKGYAYLALSANRGNANALPAMSKVEEYFFLSEVARKAGQEHAKSLELEFRSKSPLFRGFVW